MENQQLAMFKNLCRGEMGLRRRIGKMQLGKVVCDFVQVGIRQVIHQMGHGLVVAPTFAKIDQLIEQIACGFACNARKVACVRGSSFFSMAHRTGFRALGNRVGHTARGDFGRFSRAGAQTQQKDKTRKMA